MAVSKFLETLPLNEIARFSKGPPKNSVPFTGCPRQHPADSEKLVLFYDPVGVNPMVMEFKLADVLFIEELPAIITETGEGIPIIKLWIRKGARGISLEPFEVDSPIRFVQKNREFREKFSGKK